MSSAPPRASDWTRRPERGSVPLIRFMAWLSLRAGRGPSRLLLHGVVAYFLAFGGAARRAARDYLRRCLGREPRLAELYRLFFAFGATIHDRIYFLRGRFDLFELEVHGAGELGPGGALLMGAHFGSFEALRACGRHLGQRRVAMAMYEANAHKIRDVLAAIAPDAPLDVVALGRMQSMLELGALLEGGALVGLLADRTPDGDRTVEVPFLGAPAAFPTGPMRMAAALRRRVLFMAAVYRGGNRYEVRLEPVADFGDVDGLPRAVRDRRVREAVEAYARALERHCRAAPDNWFNFHDFWKRAG